MPVLEPSISPDEYAACRTLGHSWDQIPTPPEWRAPGVVYLQLRCIRCTTERRDEISVNTGDVLGRRYEHAPGYLMHKDDLMSRTTWRLAYLRMVQLIEPPSERRRRRSR